MSWGYGDILRKRKNWSFGKTLVLLLVLAVLVALCAAILVNRYYPVRHIETIYKYAEEFDLEPELVFAVIHAESRFNEDAVSRAGASGLMQIMEDTAYWLAPQAGMDDFKYSQVFDPEINIRLGTFYLSMLYRRFGDMNVALSAYNAGSGNVGRWLENPEYSNDGKTLDHIPFPETRKYVERVDTNQRIYAVILRFVDILRNF